MNQIDDTYAIPDKEPEINEEEYVHSLPLFANLDVTPKVEAAAEELAEAFGLNSLDALDRVYRAMRTPFEQENKNVD